MVTILVDSTITIGGNLEQAQGKVICYPEELWTSSSSGLRVVSTDLQINGFLSDITLKIGTLWSLATTCNQLFFTRTLLSDLPEWCPAIRVISGNLIEIRCHAYRFNPHKDYTTIHVALKY